MHIRVSIMALAALVTLSACQANTSNEADEGVLEEATGPKEAPEAEPTETVSILRAEIEQPPEPEAPLEPLNATIGFPEGGAEIDDAALIALAEVLTSEQLALGGPIVLRAHSDSSGSDTANERASQDRGLEVAEWLIVQGIDPDRIDVIVFGEQNPVEPNALPDGSPNEEGRALNRRVEVLIVPPRESDEGSAETGD